MLSQHLESLIFTTPQPITLEEIASVLREAFGREVTEQELLRGMAELKKRYDHAEHSFGIVEIGGGYQFMTKAPYHQTIGIHLRQQSTKKLSRSALETLSIVAYKQPVTRSELEKIRGVSCDYALQKLLEKELVTISGRADSVGKPLLYGVTPRFMDYFGIKSLEDLPQPRDFKIPENTIGQPEELMVEDGQQTKEA